MKLRRSQGQTRRRFRVLRAHADLTQIDVCVRADLSLTRYREIENGYGAPPSDNELEALKKVFRVEQIFEDAVAS